MTINSEQIQALKELCIKAGGEEWVAFVHSPSSTCSVHTPGDERCGDVIKWAGFDGQKNAKAKAKFIAAANPAVILSLLAERDADKSLIAELEESKANLEILYDANLCDMLPGSQYMDPPDGGNVTPLDQVARMVADYRQQIAEQAKSIAKLERALDLARNSNSVLAIRSELEARTLTVKLPKRATADKYVDGTFDNSDLAAIYNTCRLECEVKIKNACAAAGITLVVGE